MCFVVFLSHSSEIMNVNKEIGHTPFTPNEKWTYNHESYSGRGLTYLEGLSKTLRSISGEAGFSAVAVTWNTKHNIYMLQYDNERSWYSVIKQRKNHNSKGVQGHQEKVRLVGRWCEKSDMLFCQHSYPLILIILPYLLLFFLSHIPLRILFVRFVSMETFWNERRYWSRCLSRWITSRVAIVTQHLCRGFVELSVEPAQT